MKLFKIGRRRWSALCYLTSVLCLALCLLSSVFCPLAFASDNDWSVLDNQQITRYGYTHTMRLWATNCVTVTTNAATGTALFPVFKTVASTFSAGTRISAVAIRVGVGFNGTGPITSCGLSIGDGSATNKFIAGFPIGTNTANSTWFGYVGSGTNFYASATNINISLYPVGASTDALTNGYVDIFLNAVDSNRSIP